MNSQTPLPDYRMQVFDADKCQPKILSKNLQKGRSHHESKRLLVLAGFANPNSKPEWRFGKMYRSNDGRYLLWIAEGMTGTLKVYKWAYLPKIKIKWKQKI